MKIWHFTPHFPPFIGGLERCVFEVTKRQSEMDNFVIVFTSNMGQKEKEGVEDLKNNLKLYYFPTLHFPVGRISFKAIKIILSEVTRLYGRPHLIHVHFPIGGFAELGLIASKILNVPLVSHAHLEIIGDRIFKNLIPLFYLVGIRTILKNSSHFICPDNVTLQKYLQKTKLKNVKCSVAPYGVNRQIFHPVNNNKKLLWMESQKVLYVGRLAPQKSLHRIIEALNLVDRDNPNSEVELDIIGDGISRNSLIQLVKKYSLNKKIRFHGKIPHNEVPSIFRSNKYWYLVISSEFEGLPITILESMTCGLPVLVTSETMFKVNFKSSVGYLGTNSLEIAEALLFYLSDKELRNDLANKAISYTKEHDWDILTDKIMKIYFDILT